ncbi:hypothetical protein [Aeromonas allosaccharophila]|uniref:hypothetical protein n=1 Tax=Aeromonas allosaccharophila TaxID=656 RepID=UPI0006939F76|nr:hypothetical protein [Aeromonas allosaccharophila]
MHGVYEIQIDGNIIVAILHGAFNEFAVEKYANDLKVIINLFNDDNFAMLIDIREYAGATPDALVIVDNFNKWLSSKGLLAKAYVTKSPVLLDLILINTPSISNVLIARFNEIGHAREWLNEIVKSQ